MSRGDLQAPCPELHVNILIEDERNLTVGHGYNDLLPLHACITFIIRVGAYSRITKDGLRPGGCHHDIIVLTNYFVTHIIEFRLLFSVDNLFIRDSRERLRIPVDHSYSAVDQPLFIKINKDLYH